MHFRCNKLHQPCAAPDAVTSVKSLNAVEAADEVTNSNAVPPAFTLTNLPSAPVKFAGVSVNPVNAVAIEGLLFKLL